MVTRECGNLISTAAAKYQIASFTFGSVLGVLQGFGDFGSGVFWECHFWDSEICNP